MARAKRHYIPGHFWHTPVKHIRASFSQEHMTYIAADDSTDDMAKVLYESKDGKATKTFDALDWPALLNEWNIRIPSLVSTHWSQQ